MKEIIIIGAGGNSKVVIDIVSTLNLKNNELRILGILDDSPQKESLMGYPVLGSVDEAPRYQKNVHFINGIGDNKTRNAIAEKYPELNYLTVIHPSAIISCDVEIGVGSMVMPGAVINIGTKIGRGCIINTGTVIEHDNQLGDFIHIASNSTTAGSVRIGNRTMLGTGTKVIQGITIGPDTMIGAGSVVIRDIPGSCTAVGVPARVIKFK